MDTCSVVRDKIVKRSCCADDRSPLHIGRKVESDNRHGPTSGSTDGSKDRRGLLIIMVEGEQLLAGSNSGGAKFRRLFGQLESRKKASMDELGMEVVA